MGLEMLELSHSCLEIIRMFTLDDPLATFFLHLLDGELSLTQLISKNLSIVSQILFLKHVHMLILVDFPQDAVTTISIHCDNLWTNEFIELLSRAVIDLLPRSSSIHIDALRWILIAHRPFHAHLLTHHWVPLAYNF